MAELFPDEGHDETPTSHSIFLASWLSDQRQFLDTCDLFHCIFSL